MDTKQEKTDDAIKAQQKAQRKLRWMMRLVVFLGVLIVIALLGVCYGLFLQISALAE